MGVDWRGWGVAAVPLTLTLSVSPSVCALEWSVDPLAKAEIRYNDNIRSNPTLADQTEDLIHQETAQVEGALASELWDIAGTVRVEEATYTKNSELSTPIYYIGFDASYQTELGVWSARLSTLQDSTLTDTLSIDADLVSEHVPFDTDSISLGWLRSLDERTQLQLSVGRVDRAYHPIGISGLRDYEYTTFGSTVTRQYTERLNASLSLNFNGFSTPQTHTDSDTLELMAEATYQLSDTLAVSGGFGLRSSKTKVIIPATFRFESPSLGPILIPVEEIGKSKSTGPIFSLDATKSWETYSVALSASRSVSPSGFGNETVATALQARLTYKFSRRLKGVYTASLRETSSVGDNAGTSTQERFQAGPVVTWNMTEDWLLRARYVHMRVDRNIFDTAALGNRFALTLEYVWPKISGSY